MDFNLQYQVGGSDSEGKLRALKLPDLRGKRFLDLGCNRGFFCDVARRAGATRVVGVDVCADAISAARSLLPDVEFSDVGWEKFPDGKFDVVICLSAIHYARDMFALVDAVHEHLATDGLFVLEGGVYQAQASDHFNIPIPTWRQVGDRVRHLSTGFLDLLLDNFDFRVVGTSVPQAGDPISRFVIHASKQLRERQMISYHVDAADYCRAVAASWKTINSSLPSYPFVRDVAAGFPPVPAIEAHAKLVASDIAFALKTRLAFTAHLSEFPSAVVAALQRLGVRAYG